MSSAYFDVRLVGREANRARLQVVLKHPDVSVIYTGRNWWLAALSVAFDDARLDASFDAGTWCEQDGGEVDAAGFERWEKKVSTAVAQVRLLGLFNATVEKENAGRIVVRRSPGAGSEVPLSSGENARDEQGRWRGKVDPGSPRALFEVELLAGDLDTLEQKVGSWDTLVEGYYSA